MFSSKEWQLVMLNKLVWARGLERLTSVSGMLFLCRQGCILSWHGAVRKNEEQKDVYNKGIT